MKFREHRGGDVPVTVVDLPDRAALLEHIRELAKPWPTFPPVTDETVHIEPYTQGSYIVYLEDYGVLGYTNEPM